ncbi:phosphotransferase-like protein [Actinopolymorpha singaporensis]|uniref:phosphotransferase-like protein n=1 Tax=Actinopolymorpha singaporensis TaxID=117157 RepID=UPI0015611603|nr:hypothetical protein [Actinopolymorpha singaporensis]
MLNGIPCSGKSTLARAFQADMDEPWLGIDLDTFTPNLPPRRTWSEPKVLRRIVAGGNAAVAAVAEAGNDVVIELVARKDPGASFVLDDLFERLASFEVVLVYLRCSFESAKRCEPSRADEMKGLVERDYGNVEDESFDILVDTDALSVPEQVRRLTPARTSPLRTPGRVPRTPLGAYRRTSSLRPPACTAQPDGHGRVLCKRAPQSCGYSQPCRHAVRCSTHAADQEIRSGRTTAVVSYARHRETV